MSKQYWKALSLIFASLLIAFIGLLSTPFMSDKLMAEVTSMQQCSGIQSSDWIYQSVQSLVERYGINGPDACKDGFVSNHPEVRADMAEWLAQGMSRVEEVIASSISEASVKQDRLVELEQLYDGIVAEVDALERTNR